MKARYVLIALLCLFFVLPGWSRQTPETGYTDIRELPKGIMGERIRSLIDAVNSGDPERIRAFITAECTGSLKTDIPMEDHILTFKGFLQETGGIDFFSVRNYLPERKDQTVVILRDRNYQNWYGITLIFTADAKALLTGIGVNNARPPRDWKEPPLTETELLKEIGSLMERLIENGSFSGSLLVARRDHALITRASGEASKAFHVPNKVDTKFNLGSMNKMFTSVAVMQLVEQGKLSLDDPLVKFLDESWLPKAVTEKITIRHLLTHSSGLGSYFNETYVRSSRQLFRALDDYKPLIKDDRPAFEPGSRFQYSNTGMFLLGVVIEKVTAMDYFEYIRKTIYEPAGMKNSDCFEMDVPVENLAIGYSPDFQSPAGWRNNLYKHVIKGGPAGGGFSTVGDLHRFALALLNGRYLKKESLDLVWTDHLKANYGFGFRIDQGPAGKIVGHSGGFDGINSNLDIFLDSGYVVAVMSNIDMGASPLARRIKSMLGRVKVSQ